MGLASDGAGMSGTRSRSGCRCVDKGTRLMSTDTMFGTPGETTGWGNSRDVVAITGRGFGMGSRSGADTLVPGRGAVDTHGNSGITVARLEDVGIIVSGHVLKTRKSVSAR